MISMGWGSIQEWGSNNVDTVIAKSNCAKAHIVMVASQMLVLTRWQLLLS